MWYLDNIRIFLLESSVTYEQISARLNPHNTETIYHVWGYESDKNDIVCKVVGTTSLNSIRSMSRDGNFHNIYFDGNSLGNFLVKSVKASQDRTICQTLRRDLPEDSPVYTVNIELWRDESV